MHRPKLLILDEPMNGLDPVGIRKMRELLKGLSGEGVSILLSSHILEEVRYMADRIGVLSGGQICREFSVAEVAGEFGKAFEDCVIDLMERRS